MSCYLEPLPDTHPIKTIYGEIYSVCSLCYEENLKGIFPENCKHIDADVEVSWEEGFFTLEAGSSSDTGDTGDTSDAGNENDAGGTGDEDPKAAK